jgi:hypothetical protein
LRPANSLTASPKYGSSLVISEARDPGRQHDRLANVVAKRFRFGPEATRFQQRRLGRQAMTDIGGRRSAERFMTSGSNGSTAST